MEQLMKFYKNGEDIPKDATLKLRDSWYNPFVITVIGKTRSLSNIHFYDENGIKYSVGRGWFTESYFSNNPYKAIVLAEHPVLRKTASFDGMTFVVMKLKTYAEEITYDLYLPMTYLESLGYEIKAEVYKRKYFEEIVTNLLTPYFSIHLNTEFNQLFDKWKSDLLEQIAACTTKKEVIKVWDDIGFK